MENIGKYVQHHINEFGSMHSTYIKDTPDFLRTVNEVNEIEDLEGNLILVTMDVTALYTNIPNDEGMEAVREAFEEKQDTTFHREFVLRLLEILLHNNYFEFNGELFKQTIGAAMGSQPIPNYANIFMSRKIDRQKILYLKNMLLKRIFHQYFSRGSWMIFSSFSEEVPELYTEFLTTLMKFIQA